MGGNIDGPGFPRLSAALFPPAFSVFCSAEIPFSGFLFEPDTPRRSVSCFPYRSEPWPVVDRYVTMKSWSVVGCLELSSYRKCSASLRPPVEGVCCLSPHQPRTIKITRVSSAFSTGTAHRAWQVTVVRCPSLPHLSESCHRFSAEDIATLI